VRELTPVCQGTLNPNVHLITGVICGYHVEEIKDPLTRQVRYLDKLVDELAKGRNMEKILRGSWGVCPPQDPLADLQSP